MKCFLNYELVLNYLSYIMLCQYKITTINIITTR